MDNSKIVFGQMLDHYRKENNMTMEDLGKKMGKTKSAVSRWISGDNYPKVDDIEKLSELFHVSVETLIFGGATTDHEEESNKSDNVDSDYYDFFDIGLSAGGLEEFDQFYKEDDDVEQIEIANELLGKYAGRDDIFFTRINGESLNRFIPNHSLIAVKKINEIGDFSDEDIVVFAYENGYSVKRFFNDKENRQLIFSPESTVRGFHDIVVPYDLAKDLKLVGKVVMYVVNVD